MNKKIPKIAIGLCILSIILIAGFGAIYLFQNRNDNDDVISKVNVSDETIYIKLGEEYSLSKTDDTKAIKKAEFDNNNIFRIDEDFVISPIKPGEDNLTITYDDGKKEIKKIVCNSSIIKLNIGEQFDYESISVDKSKIESVSVSSDSFLVNGLDVKAISEGEGILTIIYTDGTEDNIQLICNTTTSNASDGISVNSWTMYFWTFMCDENEYCNSGNYGNFNQKRITINKIDAEGYVSTIKSIVGKNIIDDYGVIELPKKDGYYLEGFYSELNGNGTKYIDANGKVIVDDDTSHTLYANWKKETCQTYHFIQYDCQGGKGNYYGVPCATMKLSCNSMVGSYIGRDSSDSVPVRDNYIFKGFFTEPDGKGNQFTDENGKHIFDDLKSRTVYAYWTNNDCPNPHNITYNCRGGKSNDNGINCSSTLQTCSSMVGSYIGNNSTDSVPVKAGYIFKGFFTKPDGNGIQVTDNTGKYIVDDLKTKIIYANWEPKQINVVFHSNISGEKDKTITETYKSSDKNRCFGCNINGTDFKYKASVAGFGQWQSNNYIFKGWSKKKTNKTIAYSGNNNISLKFIDNVYEKKYSSQTTKGVIDLYAVWNARKTKLVLNTKNGKIVDKNMALSKNKKDGYIYIIDSNKKCYDNKCKKVIQKIKIPTRKNYTFLGYFTKKTNGTKIIDSNGYVNIDKIISKNNSITLYAQWKKKN